MSININGKIIETDEEGYLLNDDDWNVEVREALIKQLESEGYAFSNVDTRSLIHYFRGYYQKNKIQPSMHKMVLTLRQNQLFEQKSDINCLYELFPQGPIRVLSKLAGLRNPVYSHAVY